MSNSEDNDGGDEEIQAAKSVPGDDVEVDDVKDGIRLVPFSLSKHGLRSAVMTLKEYPLPENLGAAINFALGSVYGVAAVDASTDKLAGYYIGQHVPSCFGGGKVGVLGRKRVANLAQICVSSEFQKRGIAVRMGRYLLDGCHPDFDPDEYDEVIVQDTDVFNSPSWLFSDRCGFRYFPFHEAVRRLGITGYYHLELTMNHLMPGQYLKCLARSEEERELADEYERQRGAIACLISGVLPCAYYVVRYVLVCRELGGGLDGVFAAYVYGAVYPMLFARFLLAHLPPTSRGEYPPAFRYYEFWWGTVSGPLGHVLTILGGFPLFGWAGGFYIALPNVNYKKEENKRAIALIYLPISLFTLALFLAHTLLRVLRPAILTNHPYVDVLGTASFFFSVTDVAMFVSAFPSGAVAILRWNRVVYAALLLSWVALLVITIMVPGEEARKFLDLSAAACMA